MRYGTKDETSCGQNGVKAPETRAVGLSRAIPPAALLKRTEAMSRRKMFNLALASEESWVAAGDQQLLALTDALLLVGLILDSWGPTSGPVAISCADQVP